MVLTVASKYYKKQQKTKTSRLYLAKKQKIKHLRCFIVHFYHANITSRHIMNSISLVYWSIKKYYPLNYYCITHFNCHFDYYKVSSISTYPKLSATIFREMLRLLHNEIVLKNLIHLYWKQEYSFKMQLLQI